MSKKEQNNDNEIPDVLIAFFCNYYIPGINDIYNNKIWWQERGDEAVGVLKGVWGKGEKGAKSANYKRDNLPKD